MDNVNDLPYGTIIQLPAAAPPEGVVPDFDNPATEDTVAITVITVCTILATLSALLRVYAKMICARRVSIEDYLGLAAFGAYIVGIWSIGSMIATSTLFVHQWELRIGKLERLEYLALTFATAFGVLMILAKNAILLEWIRLFVVRRTHNGFFYICCVAMVVNTGLYISSIFTTNFACSPREKLWRFWVPGTCAVDRRPLDLTTAGLNLVSHLLVLLLPQRVIWQLQLTTKRKIGISIIFSMGILACASAAGRCYSTAVLNYEVDAAYGVSTVFLWGIVEMACLLIVFCVPSAPQAFADIGTSLRTLWSRTGIESSRRSRTQESNASWPLSPLNRVSGNAYQKVGEDGGTLRGGSNLTTTATYNPHRTKKQSSESHGGILRVIEFSMQEDSISTESKGNRMLSPHS
ncbi:hypothetical protein F4779DRAFT_604527 [Xylariaceae sp. FL0662B]|nr:hypothetical protein F4779DRAFT_604527 [Xylariaceae sp. FL0662B]